MTLDEFLALLARIAAMYTAMSKLDKYLVRITEGDQSLTEINLQNTKLTNTGAALLIRALCNNPNVAKNIKSLHLSDNQLSEINIPGSMSALRSLYICRNQLKECNLSLLPALTTLDLSHNELEKIDLSEQTALVMVLIRDNQSRTCNLGSLPALHTLDLDNNPLQQIFASSLPRLSVLRIIGNELTDLSHKIVRKLYTHPYVSPDVIPAGLKVQLPSVDSQMITQYFAAMLEPVRAYITSDAYKISDTLETAVEELYKKRLPPEVIAKNVLAYMPGTPLYLLSENIAMLRTVFTDDNSVLDPVNTWLATKDSMQIKEEFSTMQYNLIKRIIVKLEEKEKNTSTGKSFKPKR